MAKDPLCPLGFHPQVRWPTRCKRCFRDYKEHTVKKEDVTSTASTAALLSSSSLSLDTSGRSSSRSNLTYTNTSTLSTSEDSGYSRYSSSSSSSSATPSSSVIGSSSDAYKDYSTPYSSISSEARSRLSRYRDDVTATNSTSRPSPARELSLPSQAPVLTRRRTTDLSDAELDRDSNSSGSSSPFSSDAASETVTIKLRKANSFGGGTDSTSEDESSERPSPPVRSRTPSFREKSKERSPVPAASPKLKSKLTPSKLVAAEEAPPPSKPIFGLKKPLKKDAPVETTSSSSSPPKTEDPSSPLKPKKTKKKRLLIQEVKEVTPVFQESSEEMELEQENSADVAFIIQVKSTGKKKKTGDEDDDMMSMTTATETTETTLVDLMETTVGGMSSWEVEDMKKEVDRLKEKCDKLEKEKADILGRRVASLDAPRPQSSEYLRLQQKVNQLTSTNEDLKDEQRHLESRVKELEAELSTRPNPDIFQRQISDLRSKLTTSESQIDQLQEEKREAIQQMKDMQEEFEEMQDSFREEQAEEFANLKKELDDASKNCRLLQFKLRKVEKRADQLEAEKKELEQRLESIQDSGRIKKLEEELKKAKVEVDKLKKDNTLGVGLKKKGALVKSLSSEKETASMPPDFDPHKTLRDLQSALERESDLREQFKFAEEESTSLRQKISRIENENDTLLIQIKKMSSKSRPDLNKGKGVETGKVGEHRPNKETDKLDVDDLKLQLELNEQESKVLQKKVEELEKANTKLSKDLQKAEDKAQSLEKAAPNITKSKNVEEVTVLRRKLIEKEREVERLQTEIAANPKGSKAKPPFARAKSLEQEPSKSELEAKAELKKVQQELSKTKSESETEKRTLEEELIRAKEELDNHQSRILQIGESNKNLLTEVEALKSSLSSMKDQYENIQDDMVLKNSKLSGQKETLQDEMKKLRKDHDTIDKELRTLRETFNSRQDTWIKEKLTLQEKLRDSEQNSKKLMSIPGDKESIKLKNLLNESTKELETKTKEVNNYKEQVLHMQKESDELRRKLEDFDKVSQVHQRSLAPEPSQKTDKELKELKEKFTAEEKLHRNEMAQVKLRHDQQLATKVEEISSVQQQLSRAKRERDTFRQMVDSAQRAIAELKSRGTANRGSITGLEEAATGAHAAVGALQERIQSLEDDLGEARRDTARQKTELVTEKSTWEMRMAELQQKINEMEEERLLSGAGRVRGSSMIGRTKLELAWQKEREEQQRRLKEATTLARDLKTTLLEIEREKDRERVEAKRRFEQLKASLEEEQQEMRRKVDGAQGDLLELRDAHAKLRTANEKLRKDRERLENQREAQIKKELELKKVRSEKDKMLDQIISKLAALNPTASNSNLSQLPPKFNAAELLHHLQNVKAIEDPEDLLNPKEKKRGHFKRAASVGDTEGGDLPKSRESLASMPASYGVKSYPSAKPYLGQVSSSTLTLPSRGGGTAGRSSSSSSSGTKKFSSNMSDGGGVSSFSPQGKLSRKALSLDQNVSMPDEQKIWKGSSDAGSGSSLISMDGQYSRGSSIEKISTLEKSKGSTLVGKMKKFVKSKSIEETPAAEKLMIGSSQVSNAGSDLSLNSEMDGKEKRGIKDKVKGMFKRSTRSPSVERTRPPGTSTSSLQLQPAPERPSRENTPKREMTPSQQRPLMPSQQRPLMSATTPINLYR